MTFRIQTHGRLQEWVAEEKGYFTREGLEYVFIDNTLLNHPVAHGSDEYRSGAFETMEVGNACEVGSACHWAVNAAAAGSHGRMWGHAYSVAPAGIYVAADSAIRKPADLAGVPIAVGYHSGSHFSALSALQNVLDDETIDLAFGGGPYDRLQGLLGGDFAAANLFGNPMYVVEQLGYRKVVDTTFMIGFLLEHDAEVDDVERYFNALRHAQRDIDNEPWRYKHYYLRELPAEYHDIVDVAGFGMGERIVFEPYTRELFEQTQAWMADNDLFDDGALASVDYDTAVLV